MKRLAVLMVWLLLAVSAQAQFPSPTFNNVTIQGNLIGGTLTGTTINGSSNTLLNISLGALVPQNANTILGNKLNTTGSVAAISIPSCSTVNSALTWIVGTGFGCNTISGGGGGVSGPGSSTNNFIPQWSGTSGTVLGFGLPVGTTGNSTVVETSSGGLIANSIIPASGASAFGGVQNLTAVSHQFVVSLTAGVLALAQPAFTDISGNATNAQLASNAANTVLGSLTATTPSALAVPSCSGTTSALQWTSGGGFGCATITGGGGGTAVVQDFVGGVDYTAGTTTSLTLSSTPISAAALRVFFDGVEQAANTWSLATATVTFNAAIPLNVAIVEAGWVIVAGSTVPGGITCNVQFNSSGSFAGNGGLCYTGSNNLAIGITGSTVGTVQLFNATTGSISIIPPTGALGTVTLTLPDLTDTLLSVTSTATVTNKTMSGASNTFTAIALASLATQAANTVVGNGTGSTASPTALAVPSCSSATNALIWTSGSGFGCNTLSSAPGGATSNVQYNNSGTFAGNSGFTYDGTSVITLGVAGASVGKVTFRNASSGFITLQAVAGALGSVTLSLPATTGIVLCDVCVQTLTNKSIAGSEINSGVVGASFGGTGVNNGSSTITLGGSLTTSGAFATTFTMTAATNVTFPTSGTLLTTTGNGSGLTGLTYSQLPALAANQVLGAVTATTPSGLSVPSCSSPNNALIWNSGAGFGCNTFTTTTLWANVVSFGADPTGVSSSSTAITNAFAAANNIFFPCGTYLVTSAITPPSNTEIRGAAYGCVKVNESGLNAATVGIFDITTSNNYVSIYNMICGDFASGSCVWNHGNQTFYGSWVGVVGNMFACAFFDSNTPATPGPIPPGATAGGYDQQPFLSHLQCNAATGNALSTKVTNVGVGIGFHGTQPAGVYLEAPNIMNASTCGIEFVNSTGAIIVGPGELLNNGSDVCTFPGVGQVTFSTNISDVYADYSNSGPNYNILTNGGTVQNFHVTNTWANAALPNGNGFLFNPGSGIITQVSVVGGQIGGGNDAVCIMGGDNYEFIGVEINGGSSAVNTYNGITVNGAGAVHLKIVGSHIGAIPEIAASQFAGVWIGNSAVGAGFCQQGSKGNPDYISITGSDLTGNVSTEVNLVITPTHYLNTGNF